LAASDRDYVQNLEDRRGKPGRWVTDEALPETVELLPDPDELGGSETPGGTVPATTESLTAQQDSQSGGTVATDSPPTPSTSPPTPNPDDDPNFEPDRDYEVF
jgi:hypothetical protein